MTDIKDDQVVTNNPALEALRAEMDAILADAHKVGEEVDKANLESREEVEKLEAKVDETITKLDQTYVELDKIEKEAGDEFDKLTLEQAEDLEKDSEEK